MFRVMRWTVTAALVAGILTGVPLSARAEAGLKIGFVNVARLLAESPQATAADRSLQNEFGPRQRDLQAKVKAFKERSDKFQKDGAVMGADERRNAEEGLRKEERELSRQGDELNEDAKVRRNEALGKLKVDLLREVEAYARQNSYDLIISDGLYVNPNIDVTAQILQALQSRAGQAPAGKAPAKP